MFITAALFSVVLIVSPTQSIDCVECYLISVGPAEQVGGPTGSNYDSPVTTVIVNNGDNNYEQLSYCANSNSYLIYENNEFLNDAKQIGLNHGDSSDDLDYCGAWLNSAVTNIDLTSSSSSSSVAPVYGFYHEEWKCDYSDNSYTNKSIAYAISYDGGITFTKPNYPNNQIIIAPNTTSDHQTGEGDHQVAIVNNTWLYLYFTEWDGWNGHVTIGVARSKQSLHGQPGSWKKYLNGQFNSPGIRGDSSAISGITGTGVRWREKYNDFMSQGGGNNYDNCGYGPLLGFSNDGINDWIAMKSGLMYVDSNNWNRNAPCDELVAYSSIQSRNVSYDNNDNGGYYDLINGDDYWLYYTYLEPNGSFSDRYLARRPVSMKLYDENMNNYNVGQVHITLSMYWNDNTKDTWITTAMIPNNSGFENKNTILGKVLTKSIDDSITTKLYDCYISEWRDHMIGLDGECDNYVVLRTLGWIYSYSINNKYITTQSLYRCFDSNNYNHFVSFDENCDNQGSVEFKLGYVVV